MMNTSSRKIIIVLILSLLLFSCNRNGDEEYPLTDKDFQEGTDGLIFDFLPSAPPEKIFEETSFEIASDVWNKGAYGITEGYITAILENDYMCIINPGETECPAISDTDSKRDITKSITEDGVLLGKGAFYPEGTSSHINFRARARKLDFLSVQHTTPVILTSCYNYFTELSQDICIVPDSLSSAPKVCEVEDIELKDQGAPVAITKIETRIMPDEDDVRIGFVIYIENKGNGQLVARDKLEEACSSGKLGSKDWNMVTLSEFAFSNDDYIYKFGEEFEDSNTIECSPNPLRLVNDEDYIRCTFDNTKLGSSRIKRSTPSFMTQAYIRLDYGYTKSITKNVIIESVD